MKVIVAYSNGEAKEYDHTDFTSYENIEDIIEVDCSYNRLTYIPINITILKNLKVLNCSCNFLGSFPNHICDLENLTELCIYGNDIDWIDEEAFGKLTKLEIFDCSENELKCLPLSIYEMKNLRELDFRTNCIEYLSDSIGDLINLEVLKCPWNILAELPDSIGNLVNLKELDCAFNRLCKLPDSIINLTSLKKLDCRDKLLDFNPEVFEFVKSIEDVDSDLTEPVQIQDCYKINNYVATQVAKLALLENKTCPVELTPLSDFDKLVVFSCGHVCGKQNRVINSCPECRNKMGYVILSKEEI